ncbi:F-box protein [Quillaja saponaria]|uniref:F-box protein n=1 Tax=Quillaja saponaria TaxID=32244 RepID=A0AAD7PP42_QUISA|nr:F-box protein [Quillaja saponaria]
MLSMDLVQEQEQESSCYFDNIPDDVLLLVFNKLLDAKSLIRCLTVSKRFAFLILQTDTVSLPLLPHSHARKPNRSGFPVNLFKLLIHKLISKPLQFLHLNTKSHTNYCPHQVLKIFNQLKSVHLELPSYGGGVAVKPGDGADSLLKWKADFGSDLKRCTVLYATSFQRRTSISKRIDEDQPLLRNEEMKSRIAWTISCLIAASCEALLA